MTRGPDPKEIDALVTGAKSIGVSVSPDAAIRLVGFLERFYAWNRFGGFTRIRRADAVRLHLLDSLTLVPDLVGARTVLDIGTGGGMPGIPLALVLDGVTFTLVESRARRCTFLREIVRDFGLASRVSIHEGDAREIVHDAKRFDAVVARAFLPPRELIALGAQLITAAGCVIVMGSSDERVRPMLSSDFASSPRLVLTSERALTLPCGDELRRIFRFERTE